MRSTGRAHYCGRKRGAARATFSGFRKRTRHRVPLPPITLATVAGPILRVVDSIAIAAPAFDGRFASDWVPAMSPLADTDSFDARRGRDFLGLIDVGQGVPQGQRRLPLSRAACNSSFDRQQSRSFTAAGGSPARAVSPSCQ